LELAAFRQPTSLTLAGKDAGFSGSFLLDRSAEEGVQLTVAFEAPFPEAALIYSDEDPARLPVLELRGEVVFGSAILPRERGGLITLDPGAYDAEALEAAGVSTVAFQDSGGTLRVLE